MFIGPPAFAVAIASSASRFGPVACASRKRTPRPCPRWIAFGHAATRMNFRPSSATAVAALRDAVGEGRLALAVGGRCVEGAGTSPVAVASHELFDLQFPLRFGHRALGANGRAASRRFLSRVDQREYPDVRNRRRTLLAPEDDATRGHRSASRFPAGIVRCEVS